MVYHYFPYLLNLQSGYGEVVFTLENSFCFELLTYQLSNSYWLLTYPEDFCFDRAANQITAEVHIQEKACACHQYDVETYTQR